MAEKATPDAVARYILRHGEVVMSEIFEGSGFAVSVVEGTAYLVVLSDLPEMELHEIEIPDHLDISSVTSSGDTEGIEIAAMMADLALFDNNLPVMVQFLSATIAMMTEDLEFVIEQNHALAEQLNQANDYIHTASLLQRFAYLPIKGRMQ